MNTKALLKSPYWLFLAIALVESYLFWPGILRPDSLGQMSVASQNMLVASGDHHPPMMVFLWHYIGKLIPGSGGMLLLHEVVFWSGVYFLYQALSHRTARIVLIACAFLPQIFVLRPFVLKDIGFTASYLVVIGLLVRATVQGRTLNLTESMLAAVFLFYGSAVKFQGAFIAPLLILWMISLACKNNLKCLVYTALASWVFLWGLNGFNRLTSTPSHSWQYVKLYDLAGISLYEDKLLFPDFALNKNTFSFAKMQELYSPRRVDEMVFAQDAILRKGQTEEERGQLLSYWQTTILKYPKAYLSHRWGVLKEQLTIAPLKAPSQIKSDLKDSPSVFIKIGTLLQQWHLMTFLQMMTSIAPYLALLFFYIAYGIYGRTPLHRSLLWMNLTGVLLIGVLFIFSMAAEVRYLYLTACLLHLSHAFALEAFLKRPR
jgi:hypothetical protein